MYRLKAFKNQHLRKKGTALPSPRGSYASLDSFLVTEKNEPLALYGVYCIPMAKQKEVAEHLDMSPQRVRDLLKQGVLTRGHGQDSLDIDECRKNYIRYLRMRSKGLQNNSGDLNEEKTRLTKLQADKAELEVKEMEQSLVSVEKITEEWVGYAGNVRSKLLALPSKVSHRVQSADTYAEAEKILKEAVYDALYELSNNGL